MFEQVKQEIDDKIKTNGNNEITANRLNGVLQDMMDASAEVIGEVQQSIGDQVEANPTGEATTTLNKIKIGETNYNIPQTDTSNLATKQELQQGLSGKQDTIADLEQIRTRADEGHTALQPSATIGLLKNDGTVDTQTAGRAGNALQPLSGAQENNFASFDSNGNLQDSLCNEGTFIKGVQQNGTDLTPDANGKVNVTVQDGEDGLSAFEIAQQQGFEGDVDDWLASLKANIGEFKFITPTDTTAEAQLTTIGSTYASTIGGVSPTQSTLSVILLMNDSNNTKTMMIATQDDGNSGYEFVYAGDLQSAMPGNVLTKDKIVNDMTTGGTENVASAETVKHLDETINSSTNYDYIVGAETNKLLLKEDGTSTSVTGRAVSDFIEIGDGVQFICYTADGNSYAGYCLYNSNQGFVEAYRGSGEETITLNPKNGVKYVRFSFVSSKTKLGYTRFIKTLKTKILEEKLAYPNQGNLSLGNLVNGILYSSTGAVDTSISNRRCTAFIEVNHDRLKIRAWQAASVSYAAVCLYDSEQNYIGRCIETSEGYYNYTIYKEQCAYIRIQLAGQSSDPTEYSFEDDFGYREKIEEIEEQLEEPITADSISFDDSVSKLDANNVQSAIDKICSDIKGDFEFSKYFYPDNTYSTLNGYKINEDGSISSSLYYYNTILKVYGGQTYLIKLDNSDSSLQLGGKFASVSFSEQKPTTSSTVNVLMTCEENVPSAKTMIFTPDTDGYIIWSFYSSLRAKQGLAFAYRKNGKKITGVASSGLDISSGGQYDITQEQKEAYNVDVVTYDNGVHFYSGLTLIKVLQTLLEYDEPNIMAFGGNTASQIFFKDGMMPYIIKTQLILPHDKSTVVFYWNGNYIGSPMTENITNFAAGNIGTFNGVINGINVQISSTNNTINLIDDVTEDITIPAGSMLYRKPVINADYYSNINRSGVRNSEGLILQVGANSEGCTPQEIVNYCEQAIRVSNCKWFIVLRQNANDESDLNGAANLLKERFGSNYIDHMGYMTSMQALIDQGITPTTSSEYPDSDGNNSNPLTSTQIENNIPCDMECLDTGRVPSSFWMGAYRTGQLQEKNEGHFNAQGIECLGKYLYKMIKLLNLA